MESAQIIYMERSYAGAKKKEAIRKEDLKMDPPGREKETRGGGEGGSQNIEFWKEGWNGKSGKGKKAGA